MCNDSGGSGNDWGMNDNELDDLLERAARPLPIVADNLALVVADSIARGTRPRRRRRWLIPAIVVGGIALTAGASLTAVQLAEWQGVSMAAGDVRSTVPIPLEWVTDDGHAERCGAWIELQNPRAGDRAVLDAAITEHDWRGFGQDLYDRGTPQPDDPDGEARVGAGLEEQLRGFVSQELPEAEWLSASDDGVAVAAYGFRCTPDVP